jgi:Icc protein
VPVRLLHVSDIHAIAEPDGLLFGIDTDATLQRVLDAAAASGPFDAVVATGDVADDGEEATYLRTAGRLRGVAGEVVWAPGNHDRVEAMAVAPTVTTSWSSGHWRLHAVDTTVAGSDDGCVGDERLAQLEDLLQHTTAPHIAIALHHPPVGPCAEPLCRLADADALLRVLSRHRAVRAVLSGHLHHAFAVERDGVTFLGAPSTCVQADHDVHVLTGEPPAAQAVTLHDDGRVSVAPIVARASA